MKSDSGNKEVLRDQNGVELPNFITVTRTFTYDIAMLVESLKEDLEVWDEETIFNIITFDDHTEEQTYFLQQLELDKCVFF